MNGNRSTKTGPSDVPPNASASAVPSKLLSVPQAGTALNISTRSVWRLIAAGKLGVVRLGGCVRVPVAEIDALIAKGGA